MRSNNGTKSDGDDDLQENKYGFIPTEYAFKFSFDIPNISVLKSATINGTEPRFAVALSNNLVRVFDEHLKLYDKYAHHSSVSHIKFSTVDPAILFTSTLEGKIHVWDTRSRQCVQTFFDDSDGLLKPILSFDCNEEMICAGTELIREDAFHLFWDRRSSKILGGYWNSHAGDITQVRFHPHDTSWMSSSSVDGLINIFDLNETSEDDALMQTINVEAPVNSFSWKSEDTLSCTTSIEEFHLMNVETELSVLSTSREKILQDFQINVNYMIDGLPIKDNFFLATGENKGLVHLWNISKNSLNPGYFLEGHTDVVRTVSYNEDNDILLTSGDDGCVCFWKLKPFDDQES